MLAQTLKLVLTQLGKVIIFRYTVTQGPNDLLYIMMVLLCVIERIHTFTPNVKSYRGKYFPNFLKLNQIFRMSVQ